MGARNGASLTADGDRQEARRGGDLLGGEINAEANPRTKKPQARSGPIVAGVGNDVDPETSAQAMKARFATLDGEGERP
jgi:hypothetical protein